MALRSTQTVDRVVGLDRGDRTSRAWVLDARSGEVVECWRTPTTRVALRRRFADTPRMRIALEVGTYSPWVSRLLAGLDHEVCVANARKLRLIIFTPAGPNSAPATLRSRPSTFLYNPSPGAYHRSRQRPAKGSGPVHRSAPNLVRPGREQR